MAGVPSINTEQMREVDRLMIEEYGIALVQMMENAGRNLARLAARMTEGAAGKRFLVVAGRGNNGGGGLAAGRHIQNMGGLVEVITAAAPQDFSGVPEQQLSILEQMGVPPTASEETSDADLKERATVADLILDALVGYSLGGPPRGQVERLISITSQVGTPALSLDIPSGVDASSGEVFEPAVEAAATLTLALPKTGLGQEQVRERIGQLFLGDISVPAGLYARLGLEVPPLFEDDAVLPLVWAGKGWVV